MKKRLLSFLIVLMTVGMGYAETYKKITSLAELTDGEYVIAGIKSDAFQAMSSAHTGSLYPAVTSGFNVSGSDISTTDNSLKWTIVKDGTNYTIQSVSTSKYVGYTGSKNTASVETNVSNKSKWTVTASSSVFSFKNVNSTSRILQFNASSPRFVCYASGQQNLTLFKKAAPAGPTPLATPTNLVGEPGITKATLTWDEVAHASSYKVVVIDGDLNETPYTSETNSLELTGLAASTDYLFTVQAISNDTNFTNSLVNEDGEFTTTCQESAITFSNYTEDYDADNGNTIDLSKLFSSNSYGEVIYDCESGDVAITDATFETLDAGVYTVTAYQEASGIYCEGMAEATITIVDASLTAPTITFNNHEEDYDAENGKNKIDLSKLFSSNSTGAVTYTTSDVANSEIKESSKLYVLAPGVYTVTALQAADATCRAAIATATITINPPRYTVTFNAGSGTCDDDVRSQEVTQGEAVTLPTATPSDDCVAWDWKFVGWSTSKIGETTTAPTLLSGEYKPEGNVTLYAVYEQVLLGEEESITIDQDDMPSGGYDDADFEAHGLTFGRDDAYQNQGGIQMKNSSGKFWNKDPLPGNITSIKAKMIINSASITVGNSSEPTSNENVISLNDGEQTWTYASENRYFRVKYSGGYCVVDYITITYQPSTTTYDSNPECGPVKTYKVTLDAQSGICEETSVEGTDKDGVTLPDAGPAEYTEAGWEFAGWATEPIKTKTVTPPTFVDAEYMPSGDVTLYAVYKEEQLATTTTITDGDGTENAPYTVEQVIGLNNPGTQDQWVIGYIVGTRNSAKVDDLSDKITNFVLSMKPIAATTFDKTKHITVDYGTVEDDIKADPAGSFGRLIKIRGDLVAYFGSDPGVKSCNSYAWVTTTYSSIPPAVVKTDKTLNASKLADGTDVRIEVGAKLIVEDGTTANLGTITMATEGDTEVSEVELLGSLGDDTKVVMTRKLKNDRYYFLALPYACNLKKVTLADGTSSVGEYGKDWAVVRYDEATRAAYADTKESAWVQLAKDAMLQPGVGYNVAVGSESEVELLFPMARGAKAVDPVAINKDASVAVTCSNEGTIADDKGWNLIGTPYLSEYNGSMTLSKGEFVTYVSSFNGESYDQVEMSKAATLKPFVSYFVQVDEEGSISLANNELLKVGAQSANATDDRLSLVLSGAARTDVTTVLVNSTAYTTAYEVGSDLSKMMIHGTHPQLYTSVAGGGKLAFNAVPEDALNNIQVGYYVPEAGEYTLSLGDDAVGYDYLYLIDLEAGVTHDLTLGAYTFTTEAAGEQSERFTLSAQRITVGGIGTESEDTWMAHVYDGVVTLEGVALGSEVRVYDVAGRMIQYVQAEDSALRIAGLPEGVYVVKVAEQVARQVIVKR